MDKINLLLNIVQSIGVIVASCTAIYGIGAWRREHAGRRRYELAEEVLASFYEARDRIASIRSVGGFESESASRKVAEAEPANVKAARDSAYVLFERYKQHQVFFSRLQSLRYRFMALFGTDSAKPFDELGRIVNEMFISARMLSRLWAESPRDAARAEKLDADIRRHEQVFWQEDEASDPLLPRINKAVGDVEATCRQIIEAAAQKG